MVLSEDGMTKNSGLFGTDGVRGKYGEGFLTDENIAKLGYCAGTVLKKKRAACPSPRVLIGMDTRYSSERILSELSRGIAAAGVAVDTAGVIPTPAVSFLVEKKKYLAGAVISASHNPWRDNGIKFFSDKGEKLSDAVESAIEKRFFSAAVPRLRKNLSFVCNDASEILANEYKNALKKSIKGNLRGLKIVVDCANGSTSHLAREVFLSAGAEATILNAEPDGRNINKNCGSLHPEVMQRAVLKYGADCGVAFDGDGDRAVFCDERGRYINGDQIIGGYAVYLKKKGCLTHNTAVVTVMTNFGFMKKMAEEKIKVLVTPVGDRYVRDEMKKSGAVIGGEQSGHIIFGKLAKTGDGMLTALQVFSAMSATGQKLSEFAGFIKIYPQILLNVRVAQKIPIEEMPALKKTIEEEEKKLSGRGRILVRYSGTEPLLRIMVEGPSRREIEKIAARLKKAALA